MTWSGVLLHIHIDQAASFEMEELEQAKLIAAAESRATATSTARGPVRETGHLRGDPIEMEVLEAMARSDPPFPAKRSNSTPSITGAI
jgi:hypothetical protein